MEELLQRVADSALSIMILVSWLLWLNRQYEKLQDRFDQCLKRFESHLEHHEEID